MKALCAHCTHSIQKFDSIASYTAILRWCAGHTHMPHTAPHLCCSFHYVFAVLRTFQLFLPHPHILAEQGTLLRITCPWLWFQFDALPNVCFLTAHNTTSIAVRKYSCRLSYAYPRTSIYECIVINMRMCAYLSLTWLVLHLR